MSGQRAGHGRGRTRLHPVVRPEAGAHTQGMTRESHGTPGFSKRRQLDLAKEGLDTVSLGMAGHGPHTELCEGHDVLRGIGAASLKGSGEQIDAPRTNANDGDDSTTWGSRQGEPSVGVAEEWWAADLGTAEIVNEYRIVQNGGGLANIQNVATEARIYATNDAAVWAALPASGKLTSDPATVGWNLLATFTGALAFNDSGRVAFDPDGGRYVLFRAVSGGTLDWDVHTFELWTDRGSGDEASACGHSHLHGDRSGSTATEHSAGSVEVEDAGGYFDGANVEDALQELGVLASATVVAHGNMGAAETFDASAGEVHEGTLDANCTFTFSGAAAGQKAWLVLKLHQDATASRLVTWPASVVWPDGEEPVLSTVASQVDIVTFLSTDGGTTWYGAFAGGATSDSVKTAGRWEPVQFNDGSAEWPFVYFDGEIVMAWVED